VEDLLFLAHRIPYPPNKGDKIRSWHILKHLSERYRVHLGCFVDYAEDLAHTGVLKEICATTHFAPLPKWKSRARSLTGLLRGEPLSVACYRDAAMAEWVRQTVSVSCPAAAFLYSSQTAIYLDPLDGIRTVLDLVDVDSDKWTQYSARRKGIVRWIYAREGRTLARFEARAARRADACLLVSEPEAALFRERVPVAADKTIAVTNSVDTERFSPERDYPDPFGGAGNAIVFTGAMDYWPNADAVAWFAAEVMPRIRERVPEAHFHIVGFNPGAEVRALAERPGVSVTGSVPDTRDYLAHAACVVAPLRVARGIQNKVLEAMAMARPVVVSPQAAQGLDAVEEGELAVAGTAAETAEAVLGVLEGADGRPDGSAARRRVLANYGWEANLAALDRVLAGS
jgi:sugar transferase (PEP-CTERM/EpsH1 system associated)